MDKLLIAKSEPLWNTDKRIISLISSLIVLLFALPHFGLNSFYLHLMIMIFMHAVMAQSWNVIAGFSGQISLGHGAFFWNWSLCNIISVCSVWYIPMDKYFSWNDCFRSCCSFNWHPNVKT